MSNSIKELEFTPFILQPCKPSVGIVSTDGEYDISDIIQIIYKVPFYESENAILIWNRVPIVLSYQYDIGVFIYDILDHIEGLLEDNSGSHSVAFVSSDFSSEWKVEWRGDAIRIRANWDTVYGGLEDVLRERSVLVGSRTFVLSQWERLLRRLVADVVPLRDTGIVMRDLYRLTDLFGLIQGGGGTKKGADSTPKRNTG